MLDLVRSNRIVAHVGDMLPQVTHQATSWKSCKFNHRIYPEFTLGCTLISTMKHYAVHHHSLKRDTDL